MSEPLYAVIWLVVTVATVICVWWIGYSWATGDDDDLERTDSPREDDTEFKPQPPQWTHVTEFVHPETPAKHRDDPPHSHIVVVEQNELGEYRTTRKDRWIDRIQSDESPVHWVMEAKQNHENLRDKVRGEFGDE